MYVWDTVMKKSTKMWSFDGGLSNARVAWSPSGLQLAMGASDSNGVAGEGERGVVVLMETNEWSCEHVSHQQPIQALAWVGMADLLYCTAGSLCVQHSSLDPRSPVARPLSNDPSPYTLENEMRRITGRDDDLGLQIEALVSDPLSGRVAVSFAYPADADADAASGVGGVGGGRRLYHKVAIYLSSCHPTFTLALDDKNIISGSDGRVPVSMAFRKTGQGTTPRDARNSELCVLWEEKGENEGDTGVRHKRNEDHYSISLH